MTLTTCCKLLIYNRVDEFKSRAEATSATFNKNILIMDIGYYWNPVMKAESDVGWEQGATSGDSKATLFDFNGNIPESFKTLKYNT